MSHHFIVLQGHPTLRFCERCGLTHLLHTTERPSMESANVTASWVLVTEQDADGKPASLPGPCGDEDEDEENTM